MAIVRLRTGSVAPRGATRWRVGRVRRGSRSAAKAAMWVMHAGQGLEIAAELVAVSAEIAVAWAVPTAAMEADWEAVVATAWGTAALPAAPAEARSAADRLASADRAQERTARVDHQASAAGEAAVAVAVGAVAVEGAGNRASRVIGAV